MHLEYETEDGEIQIRDMNTDNHDIMAICPLTGDPDYDKDVLVPFVEIVCAIPSLLKTAEAAERLVTALEAHIHALTDESVGAALTALRNSLKKG